MYYSGKGVLQDYKQAVYWYKKSADQGYASAQCNLGLMYYHGEGVVNDYKQTVYWWTKSAEQGDATAQFNLGLMYILGKGVLQDFVEAYAWINIAGANGVDVSKTRKNLLQQSMTLEQIAKAQERSKVIWAKIEANKK
jgi:TPR repeat protein